MALGASAEPLRPGRGAMETVQGRVGVGAARPGALLLGRGASLGIGAPASVHARHHGPTTSGTWSGRAFDRLGCVWVAAWRRPGGPPPRPPPGGADRARA